MCAGDHQVIRHKIADMARLCDATHAMLEAVTYRMTQESVQDLGGPIALLKVASHLQERQIRAILEA